MTNIEENRKLRAVNDRRTHIVNSLHRMNVSHTRDGRKIEDCRLFTLEQVYINEMCRIGETLGDQL